VPAGPAARQDGRVTSFGRLADLDDDALRAAYAPPRLPWLRLNFVTTVDGAVDGVDGTSGSINNAADKRVFHLLRDLADAIVVGAGTVRAEGYRPNPKPVVVVSRSGELPPSLREGDLGQVYLATGARAPGLEAARALLGERVLVLGEDAPEPARLRETLEDAGFGNLLCEGGPHLAADLLAAGVVDELCSTVVPTLVGGTHARIAEGAPLGVPGGPGGVPVELHSLLESDGTLLARWMFSRG